LFFFAKIIFSSSYSRKNNPLSNLSENSRTFQTPEKPYLYLIRLLNYHINLAAAIKNGQAAAGIRYCNNTTLAS